VGKLKRLFVCSDCGRPSAQWSGRCASCGEWGTVAEHPAGAARVGSRTPLGPSRGVEDLAPGSEERRLTTGIAGIDRVLGGGLVPGSVVLLAGAPGIGKSTLLLQLASLVAASGRPCLVASGEEARGQVALRARRLGLDGSSIAFVPGRDLEDVVAAAESTNPSVLIVDSLQTIRRSDVDTPPGGPGQARACVDALVGLAKQRRMAILLVGHVTKSGDLAGPRTIEHAVDVVLSFDGEPHTGLRVLTGGKNRFGPEGEVAWFHMGEDGLAEREGGPGLGDGSGEPGCATALALAGRRALAVEIQALVVGTDGPARRQVAGLDPRRFHIVAAVADQVAGLRLMRAELFGTSAGGLRVDDPGADLAMAVSLVSASVGVPPPPSTGFAGEVALTGAIRPAGGLALRISAAAAAGLGTLVCAEGEPAPPRGAAPVRLVRVKHLRQAISWRAGKP
jgi:DNA repair protein RadA/Sms